jgi:hypothetical protein
VIDDAFKERDPQRHCAMKGLPGRVSILERPFSENLVLKRSCCPHVFVDFSIVCQDMMVWEPGKLQSHKIEDLCLMLNCTSPCTNTLSQLH